MAGSLLFDHTLISAHDVEAISCQGGTPCKQKWRKPEVARIDERNPQSPGNNLRKSSTLNTHKELQGLVRELQAFESVLNSLFTWQPHQLVHASLYRSWWVAALRVCRGVGLQGSGLGSDKRLQDARNPKTPSLNIRGGQHSSSQDTLRCLHLKRVCFKGFAAQGPCAES